MSHPVIQANKLLEQTMRKSYVAGLALLLFVLAACGPATPAPVEPTTPPVSPTQAPSATIAANGPLPSWLNIYFTNPSITDESDQNMDHYVAGHVLSVVNVAQKTIDVTSFDLNLPQFVDALV